MNSNHHVEIRQGVKMLKPKLLNEVLQQALSNGVTAAILMTVEGAPLAYSGAAEQQCNIIAAIASNIWATNAKHGQTVLDEEPLRMAIFDCQEGRMCVRKVASLLLCVYGAETVPLGMLRAKTEALCVHLSQPLTEVATID